VVYDLCHAPHTHGDLCQLYHRVRLRRVGVLLLYGLLPERLTRCGMMVSFVLPITRFMSEFRSWKLWNLDGFTAFWAPIARWSAVLCLTRLLSDKAYVPDRTACSAGCFSRLAFFYLSLSLRASSSSHATARRYITHHLYVYCTSAVGVEFYRGLFRVQLYTPIP
jgi:hypothetical protein